MNFTAAQLDAIAEHNADTCVVAGPGSGKTTVLVEHFQELVRAGIDPTRILAITFTEKAAKNMKARLASQFASDAALRSRLERAYVSTVHGFCTRLLKENAIFAGIDPEFRVIDERESLALKDSAIAEAFTEVYREKPEALAQLWRNIASNSVETVLMDAYEAMRAAGISVSALAQYPNPSDFTLATLYAGLEEILNSRTGAGWRADQAAALEEIRDWARRLLRLRVGPASGEHLRLFALEPKLNALKRSNPAYDAVRRVKQELLPAAERTVLTELHAPERALLIELIERFDRIYRARKRQSSALDFSDLEEFAANLLSRNPDVRERVRRQFDRILMDEFQDTNGQQARLVSLLRSPDSFYAVGDVNQSIYGFRHADPDVFRAYRSESRAVFLRENFRSRVQVLQAVAAISRGNGGIEAHELIAGRAFEEKRQPSVEVIAIYGTESEEMLEIEARTVAARIIELRAELGKRFGDFALLVRNSEVFPAFVRAFQQAGIPYQLNRGKGFFEHREIRDLTHLLRVLANARDEISMAVVLRSPFAGVSDETLLRLKLIGNLGSSLQRLEHENVSAFDPGELEKLRAFRDRFNRWRDERDSIGIDRLLLRAIDETGYPCEPAVRAGAPLEKFLAMARESGNRGTLADFLEEVQHGRDANPREPDAPLDEEEDAVKMLTVHAAKGLEFPVVFLAAMHKGIDTSIGNPDFSPRIGLGARWTNPHGKDHDDWFGHYIRKERETKEEHEGDRLLYVAMTRAEEHLVFSYCNTKSKQPPWVEAVESGIGVDLHSPSEAQGIQQVVDAKGNVFEVAYRRTGQPPAAGLVSANGARRASEAQVSMPPAVEDHADSTATVTSLAHFAACPRRYYLGRYLGLQAKPRSIKEFEDDEADPAGGEDELDATEFGRHVHALLAGAEQEARTPEAAMLVAQFHSSELGKRAARASRLEREFDFLFAIEEMVLRGQIDLWFEEAGEVVIVDYKTDEAPQDLSGYALQLRLYALALERFTGRVPTRAYLYLLRRNEAVPVDITPAMLNDAITTVRRFRQAQSTGSFPLNEAEHCNTCPFVRGACPSLGYRAPEAKVGRHGQLAFSW